MAFLDEYEPRDLPNIKIPGLTPRSLHLGERGETNISLEIAVFEASSRPSDGTMRDAFHGRRGGRAAPVLVVVLHDGGALLCGTGSDKPPVFEAKDVLQAERLCADALKSQDHHKAISYLKNAMPSLETALPGIVNKGLLSLHALTHGARDSRATERARGVLGKSEKDLLTALGFTSRRLDNKTELLSAKGEERTALAVLLKEDEDPKMGSARFSHLSPISYALTKADKEKLPWVVMIQGDRIRLYNTENIGVGRRGRTETYIECQTSLLSSGDIGLLWLLFSADALKAGGTIRGILEESRRFAADVADRLRERIYDTVVPELARGIVKARNLSAPSKDDLALTYEMALTVLFRLLFIAYAEDRDLLPYKGNGFYRDESLKKKAMKLAELASAETPISVGAHHWRDAVSLWEAVSRGNQEWGVPAYNGAMFSSEPSVSKAGATLKGLEVSNTHFEQALRALLLTESEGMDYAPVDFRELSVREFGTIYEGLLESELSLAEQDLTMDKKGTYLPAGKGDAVIVKTGAVYLHDRSGARKSSGSYYTPDFAVEHLLDGALEPALDEHLGRMKGLSDADRAEQFFNFRVADIAMGSGHFLVAAIDRIERRFAQWLEANKTPNITRELQYLREAAKKELGDLANTVTIEDGQLLRRMIARRCIYGVDLNAIAVQLARLSVWIHSFVPGLPLSLLDHNLVHGNALVGIGSLEEIRKKFEEGKGTLFEVDADNLLGQAKEPLEKLARLSDASIKDIEEGRALMEQARLKTLETKALCDLITAQPLAEDPRLKDYLFEDWEQLKSKVHSSTALKLALEILEPQNAFHFPIEFPEVFLGRTQGFNVILGNPPWDKIMLEKHTFLVRHYPGLRGLSAQNYVKKRDEIISKRPDLMQELEEEKWQAETLRKFIYTAPYCKIRLGHPDLYIPFCFRFLSLVSQTEGRFGVVLPRSALNANGSTDFRRELISSSGSIDIVTLRNTGGWVFNIHQQFMIGLVNVSMSHKDAGISLKGPFNSKNSYIDAKELKPEKLSKDEILNLNANITLPLLPTVESIDVLRQLSKSPALEFNVKGQWRARPLQEMNATNDADKMSFVEDCPKGFWPIYRGGSFNVWEPDTKDYYAFASPDVMHVHLQDKRQNPPKHSVHKEFAEEFLQDESTLPCNYARIAFRDVTNAIDARTVIACLIPPCRYLQHSAPYILFPRGDKKDQAFLLGVLSSIPLDWYARRFVGLHLTFVIFNHLPIPRPERTNPLWKRVVELAGRLACPDERFKDWAKAAGTEYGALDSADKEDKIHELDAVVAHLYGLTEAQLTHIFETFRVGWDYTPRLKAVLKHYQTWASKI